FDVALFGFSKVGFGIGEPSSVSGRVASGGRTASLFPGQTMTRGERFWRAKVVTRRLTAFGSPRMNGKQVRSCERA
ncbi:hypothetical protein, partial [Zavarzinella formosa]